MSLFPIAFRTERSTSLAFVQFSEMEDFWRNLNATLDFSSFVSSWGRLDKGHLS